jgi:hypothetical protein
MSNPSNHPQAGEEPTVREPAAEAAAPAEPVAPQTPPAATPPPPPPPPQPAAPRGAGWHPGQPAPGSAWPRFRFRPYRPVWLIVAVGVLGVLLGCLLGSGVTLIATHLHDGGRHGPGHGAPFYGPRRGPVERPGFPNRRLPEPAPTASPSR